MKPLAAFPLSDARALRGVLFDLDDTFLDGGRLSLEAFAALFNLRAAGLRLFVVTGRPASWGRFTVGQWPIDGAVTENGGVSIAREGKRLVERVPPGIELERLVRELAPLRAAITQRFPGLRSTEDAGGRRTDITFDIGETESVPETVVSEVIGFTHGLGALTHRSSIHLHVTLHGHDKASGAVSLLGSLYDEDPTEARYRYAYLGDSQNDAPCFAAFHSSIGVRNLSGRPTLPPLYRTEGPTSQGFTEAARLLCALRDSPWR